MSLPHASQCLKHVGLSKNKLLYREKDFLLQMSSQMQSKGLHLLIKEADKY